MARPPSTASDVDGLTPRHRQQYFRYRRHAAAHHRKMVIYRDAGLFQQADTYRDLAERCIAASIALIEGTAALDPERPTCGLTPQTCRCCGETYHRRLYQDDPCPKCNWRPYRD